MAPISILLITGSFVTPDAYASIVDRVIGQAIEIRALHLPTVGASPRQGRDGRPPTMYDDAALIAQEVDRLADQGKHVILIAHSYGGVPTSQSIQGRSISDRQRKGQRGGIVRVGYMTALVPEIGHSALDVLADVPPEGQTHMETDENGWMLHSHPAATAKISLSSLPLEESEPLIRDLAKHSAVSFTNNLTYAGYRDVPVSYLLCTADLCVPPAVQRKGIDMIERVSGTRVKVTEVACDHGVNHTSPDKVVAWIMSVVAEAQS
ncbi:hypothetical protein B0A52_01959 [Exophiala mesophila]|uniref:AB hydrolase-1 domain-containing protein n=1 Tax=Exophiala mesophila TaxID=212818 RepID=A0A438NEH6_EXOME|nr:hypothetical protein B0A52_01959 [Exophiala mesophila]